MKKLHRNRTRICTIVFALLLFVASVFPTISSGIKVYAYTEKYTSVLEDLQKDESFDVNDYPSDPDDYSLDVIQVAESSEGELFVYVYQPSDETKELVATSINISKGVGENLAFKNYRLSLLNSEGVFDKYLVKGFTVLDETERIYQISSILRFYDSSIDTAPSTNTEQTMSEKAFKVAKRWTITTVDGVVTYSATDIEVIEITSKIVGTVRYVDGFFLRSEKYTDSHFVAFTTDKPIGTLYEADIYFVTRGYKTNDAPMIDLPELSGERVYDEVSNEHYLTLLYTQAASNKGNGFYGVKYEWKRIQSVSDFLASEDISAMTFTKGVAGDLAKQTWILRFFESSYSYMDHGSAWGGDLGSSSRGVEVSDVMILRLKFETLGITYNLGVIDNKTTGSNDPVIYDDTKSDLEKKATIFFAILFLILGIILLAVLAVYCKPAFDVIMKILWWIITAPFKLIGLLFKWIASWFEKDDEGEE